jgi:hypothetical protein
LRGNERRTKKKKIIYKVFSPRKKKAKQDALAGNSGEMEGQKDRETGQGNKGGDRIFGHTTMRAEIKSP